jgi:hypothetical protein
MFIIYFIWIKPVFTRDTRYRVKAEFQHHMLRQMFQMSWRIEKLTVKMVESSWNVMAYGDAREKWRGNKRMKWEASKRHMTAEHRLARTVQTPQADVHSSPASSRQNWRPSRFKWTRPFRRKTKSGFCTCAITFQTQSTPWMSAETRRSISQTARIVVRKIVH